MSLLIPLAPLLRAGREITRPRRPRLCEYATPRLKLNSGVAGQLNRRLAAA
jgi:hypothetical protein